MVTSSNKRNPEQVFVPDSGVDEKPLHIQLDQWSCRLLLEGG